MKRKLVKQGAATLMISIPSKWAKQNKLDKGDEIDINEKNNELIISSGEIKELPRNEKIDVSGLSPITNRIIIAYYIKGVDELEINFKDTKELKEFQKRILIQLLGFEIIKQSKNQIVLKDVTGSDNQDISQLIQRIFLILDSMIEELIQIIEENQDIDSIIEIDRAINRISHFCLRILNKKGYPESSKIMQVYNAIYTLEEVGDKIKNLARSIKYEKPQKTTAPHLKEIRKLLSMFKDMFFNYSTEKAVAIAKMNETIKSEIKGKGILDAEILQIIDSIMLLHGNILVMSIKD